MKFFNKAVILLLLFTMIGGVCFAAPKKKDPLDAAIRETSDYLNSNIAKGSKIVILNIQSDNGALSEYIIDELISNAVNDRILLVVDRQQLDAIRAEQNFQFSGEVDDKQALEIGKFFGAQSIISGAMGMIGKEYRLRIRALEVQTALVQGQFNKNIAKSTLITTLISSKASGTAAAASGGKTTTTPAAASTPSKGITIVNNTGSIITMAYMMPPGTRNMSDWCDIKKSNDPNIQNGQTRTFVIAPDRVNQIQDVSVVTPNNTIYKKLNVMITEGIVLTFTTADDYNLQNKQAAAPSTPATGVTGAYRIGDTGPAAGIIFYDKGNNSDGWRYLEAAPPAAEFQAVWSVKFTDVENLRSEIGEGKKNTQLIVEKFKKTSGEWDTAAQKCDDLVHRGFDDWFLPSKDELDQMYGQLKRKDLGNFKNENYWSSRSTGGYFGTSAQNFGDGVQNNGWNPTNKLFVRPIRQVAGPDK